MKTLYNLLFFIVFFWFSDFIAFSQTAMYDAKGFVVNETNEPVEAAYIEFLKDSCTVLASAISGAKGEFEIKLPHAGHYLVGASHLAYEKYFQKIEVKSPFTILMKSSSVSLDEVVVRSDLKKMMTFKDGNLIFTPSAMGNLVTNDILQLLQKLPSIQVSTEGSVTLNGRSVAIVINGKRTNLSPSALQSYLKSIPAAQVKEIRIIPTSSAEDLAEDHGRIDILIDRTGYDSSTFNMGANMIGVNHHGEGNGNLFYAFQKKRFYLETSIGYENEYIPYTSDLSVAYTDGQTAKGSYDYHTRTNRGFGNLNMEIALPHAHKLNSSFSAFIDDGKLYTTSQYDYFNGEIQTENSADRTTRHFKNDLFSFDVAFISNDTAKARHRVSYGIIWGKAHTQSSIENRTQATNLELLENFSIFNRHYGLQHQIAYDFTYLPTPSTRWKVGVRADLGKISPLSRFDTLRATAAIPSDLLSSLYKITENLYGAYITYHQNITSATSLSAGLRGEYTDNQVTSQLSGQRTTYRRFHLFPFASVSADWAKGFASTLKFSSGIERPSFLFYLPDYSYTSKYQRSEGNPHLRPSRTYTLMWSNYLFDFVNIDLSYIRTKDKFGSVTLGDTDNRYMETTTYLNLCNANQFVGQLNIPYLFFGRKLSGYLALTGSYSRYTQFQEAVPDLNTTTKYLILTNHTEYAVWKKLSIGYDFRYQSRVYSDQAVREPYVQLDADVSYILKKFNVGFFVKDIFHTATGKGVWYHGYNITHFERDLFVQRFGFAVRYRFSKGAKTRSRHFEGADPSRFTK